MARETSQRGRHHDRKQHRVAGEVVRQQKEKEAILRHFPDPVSLLVLVLVDLYAGVREGIV